MSQAIIRSAYRPNPYILSHQGYTTHSDYPDASYVSITGINARDPVFAASPGYGILVQTLTRPLPKEKLFRKAYLVYSSKNAPALPGFLNLCERLCHKVFLCLATGQGTEHLGS